MCFHFQRVKLSVHRPNLAVAENEWTMQPDKEGGDITSGPCNLTGEE